MPNLTPTNDHFEREKRLAQHILCEFRQEVSDSFAQLQEQLDLTRSEFQTVRQLLDGAIDSVTQVHPQKSHYTPTEVAELLKRRPYTVREWCRLSRVHASKRPTGRGDSFEWEIAHEEVERIKSHGLLPPPERY